MTGYTSSSAFSALLVCALGSLARCALFSFTNCFFTYKITAVCFVSLFVFMPCFCAAFGCTNRSSRDSGIRFHRFPTDAALAKQWIRAMRRKNFTHSQHTFLCSEHFTDDDYQQNVSIMRKVGIPLKHTRLKPGAVPSVFCHNQTTGKSANPTKRKRKEVGAFQPGDWRYRR